jgi:anti-sigma factor RsiW
LSCDKWVRQISLSLTGSLGRAEAEELKKHLAGCPGCRAELVLQKEIEKALSVEAHSGLSADFAQKVGEETLRIAGRAKSARPWPVMVPPLAAAAAAAALFFMVMNLTGGDSSAFEQVVRALVKPLTWFFGLFGGLLGGAAARVSSIDPQIGRAAGLLGASLAAVIPAFWGLRRFIVYLR